MKLLAIEVENKGVVGEDFQPYLEAEARRVWELYQAEIIREVYFEAREHIAILILECESIEEGESVLETLPLVKAGLIHFELKVLGPYTGFARLWSHD